MCKYFYELQYFDQEIWTKLINDLQHKKKVSNLEFFSCYRENLSAMNKDPKNPFFQKLDKVLEVLSTRHFNRDR